MQRKEDVAKLDGWDIISSKTAEKSAVCTGETTGHTLVYCPGDKERYSTVVCSACTRFWNSLADVKRYADKINKQKGVKCPGNRGRRQQLRRKSTLQLWSNYPTWRQRLAKAWCLLPEERNLLNSVPNDFTKVCPRKWSPSCFDAGLPHNSWLWCYRICMQILCTDVV